MAKKKQQTKNGAEAVIEPLKIVQKVVRSPFVKEFSDFINRGNVVEMAIGVAVGGAFTTIVKSLVDDIIMPVASLLAGGLDFSTLAVDVPNIFGANTTAHIAYGNFLQNVVNFLIVGTLKRLNAKEVEKLEADAEKLAEK